MKLKLAKRHWFQEEEIVALEKELENLIISNELCKEYNIELSILLSTRRDKFFGQFEERVNTLTDCLNRNKVDHLLTFDDTAGEKFVFQLHKRIINDKETAIYGLACLDQWQIHTRESLEAIRDLTSRLTKENNVYAAGSRSIPVSLGVNKRASDIRTVHEIVHSLTSPGIFKVKNIPEWANPSPIYSELGESTSGFYLINPLSPQYNNLRREIEQNIDLQSYKFAIEYFTAITAGNLRSVSTGYLHTNQNLYFQGIPESEEITMVKEMIGKTTYLLRDSSVRHRIDLVLFDPKTTHLLSEYIDNSLVMETIKLMRESISNV